jgi:hypothetical protein
VALQPFGLPIVVRVAPVAVTGTALMARLVVPRAAHLPQDWLPAPPGRS